MLRNRNGPDARTMTIGKAEECGLSITTATPTQTTESKR